LNGLHSVFENLLSSISHNRIEIHGAQGQWNRLVVGKLIDILLDKSARIETRRRVAVALIKFTEGLCCEPHWFHARNYTGYMNHDAGAFK
jgi:hypothetical protein